jgi:hypothetical protein
LLCIQNTYLKFLTINYGTCQTVDLLESRIGGIAHS